MFTLPLIFIKNFSNKKFSLFLMLAKSLRAGRWPLASPIHPDVLCSDQNEEAEKGGDAWGLMCSGMIMVVLCTELSPEKMLKSSCR